MTPQRLIDKWPDVPHADMEVALGGRPSGNGALSIGMAAAWDALYDRTCALWMAKVDALAAGMTETEISEAMR